MPIWLFAAGLLALAALPAQAQSIGRVLMAIGEVSAERGGQVVPLTVGSAVENRDVIRVGSASNAQLRFTDDSLVALRANSVFVIENYSFSGRADLFTRAAFNLVKGGMRTITGLIGREDRAQYSVKTQIATVGVRGTAYTLVVCQQDCLDEEGALAPDGNYGMVQEGRVVVANAGGEQEFGVDDAFFVSDSLTRPQILGGRPGFLRDRLEARQRMRERQEGQAMRGEVDPRRDGPMPLRVAGTAQAPIAAADLKDESGNVAVLGAGLGVGIAWSAGSEERAQVEGGRGTVISLDGQSKTFEAFKFFVGGMAGARNGASLKDVGAVGGDGGMVWGRWDAGGAIELNGNTFAPPTGVFFLYGNLTPPSALPQSLATTTALVGTLTYDYIGGPSPTDGQGNVGQFLGGSFTVNFLDRTLSGNVAYQVGGIQYAIPVPDGTRLTANTGYIGFEVRGVNNGVWRNLSTGTLGSIDATSIGGLFMGSRAQGLGVVFSTSDLAVGRSAGAAVFRCRGTRC